MPTTDLDSAWMVALNEAVAQKFRFGDQVIFTLGPYASAYTAMYHPATDRLMLAASLFFATAYTAAVFLLQRRPRWSWVLVFSVLLSGIVYWTQAEEGGGDPGYFVARDGLYLSYYILFLAGVVSNVAGRGESAIASKRTSTLLELFVAAPLGLLPLMKTSFLVPSLAIAALCIIQLARHRRYGFALLIGATITATAVLAWIVSGQPVEGLSSYLINIRHTIGGYPEAMQENGPTREILAYVGAVAVACFAMAGMRLPGADRLILGIGASAVYFVGFKSGFIRHDIHALVAASLASISALTLMMVAANRSVALALGASLLLVAGIYRQHLPLSAGHFVGNIANTYSALWRGTALRFDDARPLPKRYADLMASIAQSSGLPPSLGVPMSTLLGRRPLSLPEANGHRVRPCRATQRTSRPC